MATKVRQLTHHKAILTSGVAMLLLASGFLTACGGSDNDNGSGSSQAAAVEATTPGDQGTVVNAELGEASPGKYFVTVDKDEVPAGTVTFKVTNNGLSYHEFVVVKSDLAPGDLPVDPKENEVSEDDVEVVGEAPYATPPIVPPDKQPGDEDHHIRGEGWGAELTVDLETGNYVLLCNLEGHYGSFKQYTGFTVK